MMMTARILYAVVHKATQTAVRVLESASDAREYLSNTPGYQIERVTLTAYHTTAHTYLVEYIDRPSPTSILERFRSKRLEKLQLQAPRPLGEGESILTDPRIKRKVRKLCNIPLHKTASPRSQPGYRQGSAILTSQTSMIQRLLARKER